ncbi:hypothetical protein HLRTI_003317 [Halorhabdus tiamatea SARL4B]|uniref:DUF7312 domain-containing protein n=1 Tax=Halorhabdus tiamatea SARL4B TaxID=1033806 RepID=F7PQQ1_9EURY|nr:hypothetical protein [Halorhabdus tiamatea]ERJ04724.1 hypothetical protein HLRTI_003317 [Halorhabdus tiamatea SARL4B]CCQ34696.1 hypothetical protein HTIA_2590 [Halorhabdus tiamatea SARL4B]
MADDEWNDDAVDVAAGAGPSDDSTDEDADDAEGWRFSLDDLEDDGGGDTDNDREANGFSLYGEIEAGSPSAENALFVAVGLALGLVVVAGLFL